MNMQQLVQPRSSNGHGRRKIEKDNANRFDNKFQTGNANYSRTSPGKGGGLETASHDRLIYLVTCLIGQQVEVQVQDGSVISGLFHATNADDFGVVLKMAHVIKDGSRGHKNVSDFPEKPPTRTFIVPAQDLVQVIAKGVSVTRDGLTNELQNEKQQELMTDSCISQSRHVEMGRELEPWIPDENDPVCPELDNIFDGPWNRSWDQFEANATLFGVKSTFNEELYTTKLERGTQMRELEREATRLAREIEGEDTHDLHLAEERGIQLHGNLEIDEETRFSSVCRRVEDSEYEEIQNILLDSRSDETFGDVSSSVIVNPPIKLDIGGTGDGTPASSRSLLMGDPSSLNAMSRDAYHLGPEGHVQTLLTEQAELSKQSVNDARRVHDNQSIGHAESSGTKEDKEKLILDQSRASRSEEEFKFNPNAKIFIPSQTPLRPSSPVADTPFCYPANGAPVTQIHGIPSGVVMGPSFAPQQPVIFNPHAAPMPQPYYHPNGPHYGQQMMIGQPRPLLYIPAYPTGNAVQGKGVLMNVGEPFT
ncbi:Polyadenylate-binding protein-interacting protein 3 [Orobanche gracilis]